MIIQTNTDKNIEGSKGLEAYVSEVVTNKLGHLADRVTRVEVHISDQNADKTGERDHRCVMEARPEGLQPLAVTHDAADVRLSVSGAADRLVNALTNQFSKLQDR